MRGLGDYLLNHEPLCFRALLTFALFSLMSPLVHSEGISKEEHCLAPKLQTDVRPDAEGAPTEVAVGIYMVDLTGISDPDQTLTGDFAVALTWKDPRLVHLSGCEVSLDAVWSPGLVFFNSGRLFTSRPREVSVGPGGVVRYAQRYYGTVASYHNLQDFPFDDQIFRVSLLPFEWTDKDVQLVVDETVTGRRGLLNISGWQIENVNGEIRTEPAPARNGVVPHYDFTITAHRETSYYLWKVIMPLCLIVAMSWCVFWISPELYGPQIGLSATSMLTLIAFMFATTNMLPELAYFTRLDQFIVGSTVLVFLALLESLTVTYLVSSDRKVLARRIDFGSRVVFPLTFLAVTITIFRAVI